MRERGTGKRDKTARGRMRWDGGTRRETEREREIDRLIR